MSKICLGWTVKKATVREPARFPVSRADANAQVAQLVEHVTENHGVGGSIPPLGTTLLTKKILTWAHFVANP